MNAERERTRAKIKQMAAPTFGEKSGAPIQNEKPANAVGRVNRDELQSYYIDVQELTINF